AVVPHSASLGLPTTMSIPPSLLTLTWAISNPALRVASTALTISDFLNAHGPLPTTLLTDLFLKQVKNVRQRPRRRGVAVSRQSPREGLDWTAVRQQQRGQDGPVAPLMSSTVPCLAVVRKISAGCRPASSKKPTPAVYVKPPCSNSNTK